MRSLAKYRLYFLCEPPEIDPAQPIRYVGISQCVERRFREHCTGRRSSKAVRTWIRRLKRRGLVPLMKTFAFEGTLEAMRRQEKAAIYKLRSQGADLLNKQHNAPQRYRHWPRRRKFSKGRKLGSGTLKRKVSGEVVKR